MPQRYAEASSEMVLAACQAARRAARERRHRHLRRLLDVALGHCEEVNLSGQKGGRAPAWVADLVEHLQAEAGERRSRPQDSVQALNELFRLRERCFDRSWPKDETAAGAAAGDREQAEALGRAPS